MIQALKRRNTQQFVTARTGLTLLYGLIGVFLLYAGEARADRVADQTRKTVLVALGDSLTAGYGLAPEQAFPSQLEAALKKRGHDVRVVNAGVSGDTTAAGLARLDWVIPEEADAVIVELGANDALRGLDPSQARANLDEIVTRLKKSGRKVLIAGMLAPRNLGREYAERFDPIFPALAKKHDALLYPFFLDGVAGKRTLTLPDGLHPNARGIAAIVARILPSVEKLLAQVVARARS
ncbi:MAG: arylesterase [Hyphomicrobiales bacterium]|nr:arylesterase [Hyphomicrobiales bacterium]